MNDQIPRELYIFCKANHHCNDMQDCDGGCLKYMDVDFTKSEHAFVEEFFEDKAKKFASRLQHRQKTLAKTFPQDVAVNLAAAEAVLGKQPEQPQPSGENQIEYCLRKQLVLCPHPGDCFFHGVCSITRGEKKK